MVLAEGFSRLGVPVFIADVKGDVAGLAMPGIANETTRQRAAQIGMEGYLRLSYAGSIKDIKEGIERIKWVLDPTSPNEIYIGDRKLVRDWL